MAALDDMVCFSLYSASRAMTAAYRPLLAPFGLTYPQYLVLVALWTTGTQSVGDLGAQLSLDSGTLSPLLRRLETRGILRRVRRDDDERVVDIELTDRGVSLRSEMSGVAARVASCTGLDIAAARGLLTSLHQLTADLQANTEAHAS